MTSSPLFISVAESIEIFRPMVQFGWASACCGRATTMSSSVHSRNGPPEAVRRIRSIPSVVTPASPAGRLWKIALCSLSTGMSRAPDSCTAPIRSRPLMTSASLLASSTRLPAPAAASVGRRPAAPTIAATTVSTSGSRAMSASASSPADTRVSSQPPALSSVSRRSAPSASRTTARAGRWARHCSASASTLVFADSACTR